MKNYRSLLPFLIVILILHSCTAKKAVVADTNTTDSSSIKQKISLAKTDSVTSGKGRSGVTDKKTTVLTLKTKEQLNVHKKKDTETVPSQNTDFKPQN